MLQSPPFAAQVVPVGGTWREMMTMREPDAPVMVAVLPKSTGAFVTMVRSPPSESPSRSILVFLVGWVCQTPYVPVIPLLDTALKPETAVAEVVDGPHVPPDGKHVRST